MKFPKEILSIGQSLREAGFEAHLVGGCVRDLLLGREPKDWDIATSAKPDEIQKIFSDSLYENNFGTVAIKTRSKDDRLKIVEVTTFRLDSAYSDSRHPDAVVFTSSLKDDLARRDFTVNAIAIAVPESNSLKNHQIIDPFDGQSDLDKKIIRAVGDPNKRFSEDALRLLRAVRLSTELGFKIEPATTTALKSNSALLARVAPERIRDELVKIILTPTAASGIELLESVSLLEYVLPELREGIGVGQNHHHVFTVFEHCVRSLAYAAEKGYPLEIRLAALLHDIGKPRTKRGYGRACTFYGHEIVGGRMVRKIMERLAFPKKTADLVIHLVRYHMFNYAVGEVSPAGVRRLLARVGVENIDDLIKVREADRIGSGTPKAVPYKLRHLLYMIEKVRRDPISPKMLKINGDELMPLLNIKPSPRVGQILNILLDEVMEEPENNTKKYLERRAHELNNLSDSELAALMAASKKKQAAFEQAADEAIKGKHYVK